MKRKNIQFALIAFSVCTLASACSFSVSTAQITDAWMAADPEGVERTTTYRQTDTFYAFVDLAHAPSITEVRAVWIAADVEGLDPDTRLHRVTIQSSDAVLVFDLASEILWPKGQYRVDLLLNGELETSLSFQVQ